MVENFASFAEMFQVVRTETVETKRLDDIPETEGVDFLKVDVQGAEIMVFNGARERLKSALIVDVEVEYIPLYKNQPLFADIDSALRAHGLAARLSP